MYHDNLSYSSDIHIRKCFVDYYDWIFLIIAFVSLGHDRFIILLYLSCFIITCFAFNQVELIIEVSKRYKNKDK